MMRRRFEGALPALSYPSYFPPPHPQVVNLPELLSLCNGWRHTDLKTGTAFAATCANYQPGGDLAANMAGGERTVQGLRGMLLLNIAARQQAPLTCNLHVVLPEVPSRRASPTPQLCGALT